MNWTKVIIEIVTAGLMIIKEIIGDGNTKK